MATKLDPYADYRREYNRLWMRRHRARKLEERQEIEEALTYLRQFGAAARQEDRDRRKRARRRKPVVLRQRSAAPAANDNTGIVRIVSFFRPAPNPP